MTRKGNAILGGIVMLAAAGLGTGVAIAAGGSPAEPGAAGTSPGTAQTAPAQTVPAQATPAPGSSASSGPSYSWYRSMMGDRYGSGGYPGMMGGSSGAWMMSQAGYEWMTGGTSGTSVPGWMLGQALPGAMMNGAAGTAPGSIMGSLFASAPGPRVSPAQAAMLGSQVPAGASVDKATRTITFTAPDVSLVVIASPSMPAESFRAAGMTDPAISVPAGAHVRIELINADADMAHGLVIMPAGAASSAMPMMTGTPAFGGAALWFLGESASAGMHAGTLSFTATAPGSYQYLCPVPGHAREGMAGTFTVR